MSSEAIRGPQPIGANELVRYFDVFRGFCSEPSSPEFDQTQYNISSTYRKYKNSAIFQNRPWGEPVYRASRRVTGRVVAEIARNGLSDIVTAIRHPFSYVYQWDEDTKLMALYGGALRERKLAREQIIKHPYLGSEESESLTQKILDCNYILKLVEEQIKLRKASQELRKAA